MIEGEKKKRKEIEICQIDNTSCKFYNHPADVYNGVYLTVYARP